MSTRIVKRDEPITASTTGATIPKREAAIAQMSVDDDLGSHTVDDLADGFRMRECRAATPYASSARRRLVGGGARPQAAAPCLVASFDSKCDSSRAGGSSRRPRTAGAARHPLPADDPGSRPRTSPRTGETR